MAICMLHAGKHRRVGRIDERELLALAVASAVCRLRFPRDSLALGWASLVSFLLRCPAVTHQCCIAVIAVFVCGAGAGCESTTADAATSRQARSTASPPAREPPTARQGSEAQGPVAINEVAMAPKRGPDWIELYNRSDASVDIAGWFITDSAERFDHYYEFPAGSVLAPNAYAIVWADGGREGEGHHAPFSLSRAESVLLLDANGLAVDSLLYFADKTTHVLGRIDNGNGTFSPVAGTSGVTNEGSAQ